MVSQPRSPSLLQTTPFERQLPRYDLIQPENKRKSLIESIDLTPEEQTSNAEPTELTEEQVDSFFGKLPSQSGVTTPGILIPSIEERLIELADLALGSQILNAELLTEEQEEKLQNFINRRLLQHNQNRLLQES